MQSLNDATNNFHACIGMSEKGGGVEFEEGFGGLDGFGGSRNQLAQPIKAKEVTMMGFGWIWMDKTS